jgi:hypothetical protein
VYSKSGEQKRFDNQYAASNYCKEINGMMLRFVAGNHSQADLVSNALSGKLKVEKFTTIG